MLFPNIPGQREIARKLPENYHAKEIKEASEYNESNEESKKDSLEIKNSPEEDVQKVEENTEIHMPESAIIKEESPNVETETNSLDEKSTPSTTSSK